jgi:peroxiredoxin
MAAGLLAGRLLLAAVFAVASLAKLSDRTGWRQGVSDFGIPSRFVAPVALLVPLAEFATAAALLPTASARWGALGAVALLGALSFAVAVQLARGQRPECHCFGRLHSAPVGRWTLVRNGALAAVAGGVAWRGWDDAGRGVTDGLGGLSVPSWLGASTAVLVLAGLGVQGWLILNLLRQNGRILLRLDALDAGRVTGPAVGTAGPPNGRHARGHSRASRPLAPAVGEPAPHLALPDLHGRMVDLSDGHDRAVLVLFWSPDCVFCQQLLDSVRAWERERRSDGRGLLVVSTGSVEANRALGLRSPVLIDEARRVMRAFGAHGTPMAVLVDATGAIGSPLAAGVAEVRALAEADARQPVTTTSDAPSDHRDGRG